MSMFMVRLLPEEADSLDHPAVVGCKDLLERMTNAYGCTLKTFAIDHGVVFFSVDGDKITEDLLDIFSEILPTTPTIVPDEQAFSTEAGKVLREARRQ